MNGNEIVSQFIAGLIWEQLPASVKHKARLTLLDNMAATLGSMRAPISRITADLAPEIWPGTGSTILFGGRPASPLAAAFANASAANGIDIDDCGIYTKGHPGAQIFPTALALAEANGLSGLQLLTGMVVGYEVAHRAGRIWHQLHPEYQACASWGSVACSAVAAHLSGLSPALTQQALGIADYYAPNVPMMRDIDHPAMVKHGIGWGSMTGILAARLASAGFTAVPSLLGMEPYSAWVSDIGQNYLMVDGLISKEYACCAWAHTAIDATLALVRQHHLSADDIAHIRIDGFYDTVRLGTALPATTEQAQFNVAWPLACILLEGQIGPVQVGEAGFADPRRRALAERIELVQSAEFEDLYQRFVVGDSSGRYLSASSITLRDGRTYSSGPVEGGINYPQIWDDDKIIRKFRWLAGYVLDPQSVEQLIELAMQMETANDVSLLARLAVVRL